MELDSQTKRYIDRFNAKSAAVSRILIIWVPAMLVLWLSGLEPRSREISEYAAAKVAFAKASDSLSARSSLISEPIPDGEQEKLTKLEERKRDAKEQALVQFKLPGGIELPIPVVWAPTAWIALAFTMLAFIVQQRFQLSTLCARVGSRLVTAPDLAPLLHESLEEAPFWLAPIGKVEGKVVSKASCLAVVGWRSDERQALLYLLACTALIAVELYVSTLSFSFSKASGKGLEQWLPPFIAMTLVSASIALVVLSLIQRPLPDFLYSDPLPDCRSRRQFLWSAILGSLAVPFLATASRLPIHGLARPFARSPRFRIGKVNKRSVPLEVASRGLHANTRSRVVHYVMDSGTILGAYGIKGSNLTPIAASEVQAPNEPQHVNRARASASFELTALKFLTNDDHRAACDSLLRAIYYDRVRVALSHRADLRTFDLLAGLAIRFDMPEYISKVTSEVDLRRAKLLPSSAGNSAGKDVAALMLRIRKWENKGGKWYKTWKGKSRPVKWCALPMQDTRNAGDERSIRSRTSLTCVSV